VNISQGTLHSAQLVLQWIAILLVSLAIIEIGDRRRS